LETAKARRGVRRGAEGQGCAQDRRSARKPGARIAREGGEVRSLTPAGDGRWPVFQAGKAARENEGMQIEADSLNIEKQSFQNRKWKQRIGRESGEIESRAPRVERNSSTFEGE
jgi:hypothetical protein